MQALAFLLFILTALLLDTIEEDERARRKEARRIVTNMKLILGGK